MLILFARTSPSYILLPVIDSALEEGKKSFVFFFFLMVKLSCTYRMKVTVNKNFPKASL